MDEPRCITRALGILGAAILLGAAPARAQTPAELLERKLASPFLKKAPWTLDLAEARARALEERRLLLGYFTTSGP